MRLFVAEELTAAGVTPETLMKAQGFDPAPPEPRWPAGDGQDSGQWPGGASVDTAGIKKFIARLALEAARLAAMRAPNRRLHRTGQRIGWITPAGSLAL